MTLTTGSSRYRNRNCFLKNNSLVLGVSNLRREHAVTKNGEIKFRVVAELKIRAWPWSTDNDVKWYMKCFLYWTADLKSSKLWSSQLRTQFKQLRIEAWKSQDFNGVWTRDLAIPVRHSNQLRCEATDVGSWSFVSSNEPVKNGCEVIYEMFHILII